MFVEFVILMIFYDFIIDVGKYSCLGVIVILRLVFEWMIVVFCVL